MYSLDFFKRYKIKKIYLIPHSVMQKANQNLIYRLSDKILNNSHTNFQRYNFHIILGSSLNFLNV